MSLMQDPICLNFNVLFKKRTPLKLMTLIQESIYSNQSIHTDDPIIILSGLTEIFALA